MFATILIEPQERIVPIRNDKQEKHKVTKKELVLSWLQSGKTLTSWEAIQQFRATRLSGIIYDLTHREGHKIVDIADEVKKQLIEQGETEKAHAINYSIYKMKFDEFELKG